MKYKLPSEVGLQAIHPQPKQDRRMGKRVTTKPKRYVVTRKDRPELYTK